MKKKIVISTVIILTALVIVSILVYGAMSTPHVKQIQLSEEAEILADVSSDLSMVFEVNMGGLLGEWYLEEWQSGNCISSEMIISGRNNKACKYAVSIGGAEQEQIWTVISSVDGVRTQIGPRSYLYPEGKELMASFVSGIMYNHRVRKELVAGDENIMVIKASSFEDGKLETLMDGDRIDFEKSLEQYDHAVVLRLKVLE